MSTHGGGHFQDKVYAVEVAPAILNIASVLHLEAVNILVALKYGVNIGQIKK